MRYVLLTIAIVFLFSACRNSSQEKPAITIGSITMTSREFNDAFNTMPSAEYDQKDKTAFLDNLILRKLMLYEAERVGLDKDPKFLNDIQLFWEQSLLKLIIEKKTNELSSGIVVDDAEVNSYYLKNKESEFPQSELNQVYDQIKWLLFRKKQQQLISDWAESLKRNTKISIDYKALGVMPDKQEE